MKNKVILIILVFIILLNFLFGPSYKKVNAEAITMTSGLAIFLKALYATGITILGGHAVKELTEESIELYREWQEFINKQQEPDKKLPDDWEKKAWLSLVGVSALNEFKKVVDSVRDFLTEKGGREGDNNYIPGGVDYTENNIIEKIVPLTTQEQRIYNSLKIYYNRNLIEIPYYTIRYMGTNQISFGSAPEFKYYEDYIYVNGEKVELSYNFLTNYGDETSIKVRIEINDRVKISIVEPNKGQYYESDTISHLLTDDYEDIKIINYYIDENSYYVTNNEDDIRYVYPDLKNLSDKLVKVINPDGSSYLIYKGSLDELFEEWEKNINPENIFTDKETKITETDEGIIIETEEETKPGSDENPYEIPEEDISIDWSPLQNITLKEKFPFSLPWDLKRVFELFIAEREAPVWRVPIKEHEIVIDFNTFEELARITRAFNLIIFVAVLIILTRKFISGP